MGKDHVQNTLQAINGKHRRRAAAEINGIDGMVLAIGCAKDQLTAKRVGVSPHTRRIGVRKGAKITVKTFTAAKWDMKIKSE